jgi:hypothetical protein
MNKEQEFRAAEYRERRIDEALSETFPASDPPSFVGAGAPRPPENMTGEAKPRKAAEMAGEIIDRHADLSASSEEQESRKRRLLKGPKEFRELRRDHPHGKR